MWTSYKQRLLNLTKPVYAYSQFCACAAFYSRIWTVFCALTLWVTVCIISASLFGSVHLHMPKKLSKDTAPDTAATSLFTTLLCHMLHAVGAHFCAKRREEWTGQVFNCDKWWSLLIITAWRCKIIRVSRYLLSRLWHLYSNQSKQYK